MLFSIFKKNGGFSLLKKYMYNHVFLYAIIVFFIFPKNKTGLELFRECIENKIYDKIKRKYSKYLVRSNVAISNSKNKIIWFCWFQGLENAPELVNVCYKSIQKNQPDYEIKVITSKNYFEYTNFPDFIIKKWKEGVISNAHFSDLLRTNLLINHGGTWIDSTVLMTSKIPNEIELSNFFVFRLQKPGSDGRATKSSSWFISACKNNSVLLLTQNLLYEYWKKKNYLSDYFLFHIFLEMALSVYPEYIEKMPKYTNEDPHLLLFELKNIFDKSRYESISKRSFVHKLTNKMELDDMKKENTFYKYIISLYKK